MIKKKLLIVQNNCDWQSWPQKIQALKSWFYPVVDFQITTIKTDFTDIPFIKYSNVDSNNTQVDPNLLKGIEPKYYDEHFSVLAVNYDILLVVLPIEQWPYDDQARGWRTDSTLGVIELHIGCDENEKMLWFGHDDGDMFFQLARHEILHALYVMTGQEDRVHYWWNQGPEKLINCLNELKLKPVTENEKISTIMKIINWISSQINQLLMAQKKDYIEIWAKAIQENEGWYPGSRSYRNSNPGNFRFCGQYTAIGKDDKNFAIFPSYEVGFAHLKKVLTNACTGKSQVYKPEMTIAQFFSIYAPAFDFNDPTAYAKFVSSKLGLPITTPIKNLLV
jgi:hypothetical protein